MPDTFSAQEAAHRLGVTKPTVISMIGKGWLHASQEPHGSRFRWRVEERSVDEYLEAHGKKDADVLRHRPTLKSVEARISRIEKIVSVSHFQAAGGVKREVDVSEQLDNALARNVLLEEILARTRESVSIQREADSARALTVEHLLKAVASSQEAERLQIRAQSQLEDIIHSFSTPDNLKDLVT
jgi:excisionase family DNA binding protein